MIYVNLIYKSIHLWRNDFLKRFRGWFFRRKGAGWYDEGNSDSTVSYECKMVDNYGLVKSWIFNVFVFGKGWKKLSAPPGNRTRVARMGILHDTTTPAVPLRSSGIHCDDKGRTTEGSSSPLLIQKYFIDFIVNDENSIRTRTIFITLNELDKSMFS